MAEKEFESDDPYAFVATRFPVPAGVDADYQMARVFVEEYALMGVPGNRIRELFSDSFYAGTHDVYVRRGAEFVESIIAEVFGAPLPAAAATATVAAPSAVPVQISQKGA